MIPVIEIFVALVWIAILCTAIGAAALLIQAVSSQQQQYRRATTKIYSSRHQIDTQPQSSRIRKPAPYGHIPTQKKGREQPLRAVPSQLQAKLFSLTNGDRGTAMRLVEHIRKTNPLQPEQWVWEKAIYDLERDRL